MDAAATTASTSKTTLDDGQLWIPPAQILPGGLFLNMEERNDLADPMPWVSVWDVSNVVFRDARIVFRPDRRHGIASAHFICPSKPSDAAIERSR